MLEGKKYKNVDDFLSDHSFWRWVQYGENKENWEEWILQDSERAKIVDEARLLVLSMKVKEFSVSNEETQAELQAVWNKIEKTKNIKLGFKTKIISLLKVASIVFVIGFSLTLLYSELNTKSSKQLTYVDLIKEVDNGLIEQINNTNKPQLITLSDASSVLLQPKSKLSYPKTFDRNERKVYLSGEAFFEISKDSNSIFYVYSNEIVTTVVGTSFRIIAFPNRNNMEVLVKTGIVKVNSNDRLQKSSSKEILLQANQATKFNRADHSFNVVLDISTDIPLFKSTQSIERIDFEFNDVPVHQILKTIELAYLVNISFPNELMAECYLTTSLTDEPLPEKLKIICESIGGNTRYEMNGNQIIIFSNGC